MFRRSMSIAIALVGCLVVPIQASDAGQADVQAQIDELLAEIRAYGQSSDQWLDDERRAEISGIVRDVLADSADRVSLQDDASIAGWKKGFQLRSPDGNFLLKVGGQVQVRFVLNRAKKGGDPTVDNDLIPFNDQTYAWGFENRRTKLQFSGHVVDPSWTYRIKGGYERVLGGEFLLEESWVAKSLGDGWKVKVGQFKPPWMREELVSSSKQLAVERSMVNEYFNQGYSQGVEIAWSSDDVKVAAWYGDGIGARNLGRARTSGQNTAWNETATNYSFASRGEWRLAGDWSQFKDFSSARGSEFGAMLGVAGTIQRGNQKLGDRDGVLSGGVTADVTLEFNGASLFASAVWTNVQSGAGKGGSNQPWGVTVQGGYFVSEDVEVFGRWECMNFDLSAQPEGYYTRQQPDPQPDTGRFDGFTVGANWFFNPAVKLTVDWTINFDSLSTGAFVSNGAGFRVDAAGKTNQWALRAQLQLLF
ncbi:MAG: hypothetical protein GY895_08570 [Phycisphaera sp.]|nr:hypothetical protein [Phycisphaera sp.]